MNILKRFNLKFTGGVPINIGDFYYAQDMIRDYRFMQDQLGQLAYDLTGQRMPVRMSGGVVTQGSGTTLNITSGNGWVQFNVSYPNSLSSLPGTVSTGDLMGVPVSWTAQTNLAIPSATADGVTINYVKIQYAEADGNTRTYAKKSGTYAYESNPSYAIVVNSTAPTQYDLCLGTFTLTGGGVFSFNDPTVTYPIWSNLSYMPVGSSIDYSGVAIPSGWLQEDGSSLLRASYPALWNVLQATVSGVFTTTLSTNTVFTQTSHPFVMGDCISIVSTTGTLPTGITTETKYYVNYLTANTFKLSTTYSGAVAGTGLVGTTAGSGNFTIRWNPWGIASATTFYLPDTRGLASEGAGTPSSLVIDWASSNYLGRLGLYKQDQGQGHIHNLPYSGQLITAGSGIGSGAVYGGTTAFSATLVPVTDGSNGTPRTGLLTAGPRVGKYKIIKVI